MGGVAVLNPQDYDNDLFSTPLKSRRTPKFTRSEGRKRSAPAGLRKNKSTTAMVVDQPATAAAKNLVMGQVKILKRGEPFRESLTVLKSSSDQNISNGTSTTTRPTTMKDVDRKVSYQRVLPTKKKENKKNSNPNFEELKIDDFALSSTDRLGPDPEMVPKKKHLGVFFAGSVFVDSPPPSSVPLPGFFTKNILKEDPSTDLQRILGLNLSHL